MGSEVFRCFSTTVTVRMGDADLTNRAYTSRFYEWSHQGLEDLLVAADDRLDSAFREEGWGMPLVHAEVTVHAAAAFGQTLELRLSVERIGSRSLTFRVQFLDTDGGKVASTKLVHTFVMLDAIEASIEVPQRLLRALRRLGLIGG